MAVIQISKIQVRRGLQENLPQLASGEMGWSVDTGNLYIGNGTVSEGAPLPGVTQILTSNSDVLSAISSYTFKGTESGYTSRTGSSANNPVRRSLQNKFDEQISARDFGAIGDGTTDDTLALQRAIDQIFNQDYYTSTSVRRQLHIPAGTYITTENLIIPPFASIFGDGPRSTIIKKTAGSDTVIRLKDSRGNVGASVDTITSDAPFEITVRDLTLQSQVDSDVALLESCQYVKFDGVRFQGSLTAPVSESAGSYRAAVLILTPTANTNNLSFNHCEFSRSVYGIWTSGNVSAITVNDSMFSTLYQGLRSNATVTGTKIIASTFDNIAAEAIRSYGASSVTTAFNLYKTVGYGNSISVTSTTPSSVVLNWDSSKNASISDSFTRSAADIATYALTKTGNVAVSQLEQPLFTTGSLQSSTGLVDTLPNNTSNYSTSCVVPGSNTAIIDYQLTRNSAVRHGTIRVVRTAANVVTFEDDYSQTADLGVTLDVVGNRIYSQTTSTGFDATFKFIVRSFI